MSEPGAGAGTSTGAAAAVAVEGSPAPVFVHLVVGRADSVPDSDAWLSPYERAVLEDLRVPKRRRDWRLGRWVAGRAVRRALMAAGIRGPAMLSILAGEDGAPEARGPDGDRLPVTLSISHSGEIGLAVATIGDVALGCDVETIEARSEAFVADYLTPGEQAFVEWARRWGGGGRAWAATLIWSAKESSLKALRQGLRADTRSVEVDLREAYVDVTPDARPERWRPMAVVTEAGIRMEGYWQVAKGAVWTVVASGPIRLR